MEAIYRKQGRKYIKIGYDWAGFPVDGIWYVQNGKTNMRCLIRADEPVPVLALQYRVHTEGLCRRLMMDFKNKPHSWEDVAKKACDYFAELTEGVKE